MIKLIKLEYKKHKIGKYITIVLALTVLLAIFLFAMTYLGIARDSGSGVVEMAIEGTTASSLVELLTTIAFLILSSSMLAAFIVDEYKNRTMDVMFQYPTPRKKIMISKILAVLLFNIVAIVVCKLAIYTVLYIGSFGLAPDFPLDGISFLLPSFYISIILQSLSTVCLSIIALYIGLLLKSARATIITSFLLIFVTQGSIGSLSLSGNMLSSIILIVISIFCAFLCIAKLDTKDVVGGK